MELLITIGIFAVSLVLLSVGVIFGGKSVRPKCIPPDEADEGAGCQFCGQDSPGVCAQESTENRALLNTTLVEPACERQQ